MVQNYQKISILKKGLIQYYFVIVNWPWNTNLVIFNKFYLFKKYLLIFGKKSYSLLTTKFWNPTTQLTVLGSKHYVKRLLAIFHSPYFFRVPSSSPRFYVKNLLSFMSPIWNKIIWKVSRVGSNRRLFTTGKYIEKNIALLDSFLSIKWLITPWNSCWEQGF